MYAKIITTKAYTVEMSEDQARDVISFSNKVEGDGGQVVMFTTSEVETIQNLKSALMGTGLKTTAWQDKKKD